MRALQTIAAAALSLAFLLTCCGNKNKPVEKETKELQGVVATTPFEYDENRLKYIFLDGMLNDSIPMRLLFDTGWYTISFPYKYKEMVEGESPMTVKIGEWSKTYAPGWENRDFFSENHPLPQVMGDDLAVIGWDFFDGKIVEISFRDKLIREYADARNLPTGYDSLKIHKDMNKNGIPISVLVQGKKIEEYMTIDTGANGSMTFNSDIAPKYGLNMDTAANRLATRVEGKTDGGVLAVDSVYVGNSLVTKHNVAFVGKNAVKKPFSGLLGTRVLEKFDIILDLKNNVFYYKLRTDM